MGRLAEVQLGANTFANYTYDVQGCTSVAGAGCAGATNAQGQRTRKVTPSGTVVYHYDLAGNLISETTDTGTPIRDYVWQDATPLAQIEAGVPEKLIFLHTDHLQTPRLATNTSGNAVWRWEGEAFGNTPPNEDVDGDGQVTVINGRFPGQYFDQETGRHYNWNRYYDTNTGRYITSDPVGLQADLNSYSYVSANPLKFTDPTGETVLVSPKMTSALPNSDVMTGLECISDCLKTTVWLTSGKRTVQRNEAVGGVNDSEHLQGRAADIYKLTPNERKVRKAAALCGFFVVRTVYRSHIHIDLRDARRPRAKAPECACTELRNEP